MTVLGGIQKISTSTIKVVFKRCKIPVESHSLRYAILGTRPGRVRIESLGEEVESLGDLVESLGEEVDPLGEEVEVCLDVGEVLPTPRKLGREVALTTARLLRDPLVGPPSPRFFTLFVCTRFVCLSIWRGEDGRNNSGISVTPNSHFAALASASPIIWANSLDFRESISLTSLSLLSCFRPSSPFSLISVCARMTPWTCIH